MGTCRTSISIPASGKQAEFLLRASIEGAAGGQAGVVVLRGDEDVTGEFNVQSMIEGDVVRAIVSPPPRAGDIVLVWVEQETINKPLTEEQATALRAAAYSVESDPLFFKMQRGEATREEWLEKVAEIRARYPKPATE